MDSCIPCCPRVHVGLRLVPVLCPSLSSVSRFLAGAAVCSLSLCWVLSEQPGARRSPPALSHGTLEERLIKGRFAEVRRDRRGARAIFRQRRGPAPLQAPRGKRRGRCWTGNTGVGWGKPLVRAVALGTAPTPRRPAQGSRDSPPAPVSSGHQAPARRAQRRGFLDGALGGRRLGAGPEGRNASCVPAVLMASSVGETSPPILPPSNIL